MAAFLEFVHAIPPTTDGTGQAAPPAKRARTAQVHDSIPIAREHLTVISGGGPTSHDNSTTTREDVGRLLDVRLCKADHGVQTIGDWHLRLKPRANYRGRGFALMLPLDGKNITQSLVTALTVALFQGFNTGEEGCLWTAVEIAVQQRGESVRLDLSIEVNWNGRSTIWGSERSKSNSQQTLRDQVLGTWFPDLNLKDSKAQPSWSPQDFYEAAHVPDKGRLDPEASSMEIPGLEASLYPFQRRAVQWLLRREGVEWHLDPQSSQAGIRPYIPLATPDPSISFAPTKDASGKVFYLSPLLGAATRDTSLFLPLQDFRGGILAEEMGLGKTLEVIALILLHRRPESPVMVFDPFLARELLTTKATLIIAPSSLLDRTSNPCSFFPFRGPRGFVCLPPPPAPLFPASPRCPD
jgi:E3 ubiquitin-protein ligase SHPRH